MTIKAGDKIPSVTLKHLTDNGLADIRTDEVLGSGKAILFAVPGAFTPTCSAKHLPSYVNNMMKFNDAGVKTIACLAVNDPFVMNAWAKANNALGPILFLPDGNATFTKALGLEMDGTGYGMGIRSQRFALLIEDGVVQHVAIEAPGKFEVSSGEAMLDVLRGKKAA